jgi:hypothetical protein
VVGDSSQHLFLTDGVEGYIDTGVLVFLEKILDVQQEEVGGFAFGRELIPRLEESVVEVEEVNVLGALYKLAIGQHWRVKVPILLKHLPVESDVSSVQDGAHVALDQGHGRSRHVVGVQKGDCQFESAGLPDDCGAVVGQLFLNRRECYQTG